MDATLLGTAGDGDWRRGDRKSTEDKKNRQKRILICEAGAEIEYIHLSFRCCRDWRTRM